MKFYSIGFQTHKFVIEWIYVIQRKGVLDTESGQVKVMRRRFLAAALGMSMAVAMTPAAAFAEETSTEEATEVVSEVASEEDTDAEEESSEAETKAFDYSEGYDEKGFFEGVKALDYVTLLDYSHMELSDEIIPSDEAVQSQIDKTLSSYTKTNQITDENRLIEDGDTVNIDYVGSVDGVEFEGGSTDGKGATVTIGVTSFIDGFLDQLIGHAPGENFDINVTFPDPYTNNTDLSGKDAVFNITINYIEEKITPEFDDDFIAENLPDYESAEAYRQSVYDNLYKQNMYNALFQYVVENSEIKDVPEEVVDTVYNERYQYYTSIASMYGVGIDAFLSANGLDEDSFRDMCKTYAGNYLVLQAVMETEGWEMTADIAKESLNFTDEDYEKAVGVYGEPYVMFAASTDYVLGKLSENVTLVEMEEESSEEVSEEASSEVSSEEVSSEEVSTEEASSEAE